jgi:hypothetical protein
MARADRSMTVEPASQRRPGVVQMKGPDAIQADPPLQLLQGVLVSFGAHEVVAGGQQMAGVEADSEPLRAPHPIQDPGQVLEAVAERGALARGDLQQGHDRQSFSPLEGEVEALCDGVKAGFHPRAPMSPRMEDQVGNAEGVATLHLLKKGRPAPAEIVAIG